MHSVILWQLLLCVSAALRALLLQKSSQVAGGRRDDTLTGGDRNDTIQGGVGNDLLNGGGGDDRMLGQGGDDMMYGGGENDVVDGGAGRDTATLWDWLDSRAQIEVWGPKQMEVLRWGVGSGEKGAGVARWPTEVGPTGGGFGERMAGRAGMCWMARVGRPDDEWRIYLSPHWGFPKTHPGRVGYCAQVGLSGGGMRVRDTFGDENVGRPFRALLLWVGLTQGVALGWRMSPPWGWRRLAA